MTAKCLQAEDAGNPSAVDLNEEEAYGGKWAETQYCTDDLEQQRPDGNRTPGLNPLSTPQPVGAKFGGAEFRGSIRNGDSPSKH